MTIQEATLNALCGDEVKYNLIMQRTRQADIVKMRFEIFIILYSQGFTQKSIGQFFKIERSAISYGIKKILNSSNSDLLQPISATLLREIYKSIPKENKGLIIEALRLKGYKFAEIGDWFNIKDKRARYLMGKETAKRELREFQERRKEIYKF